MIWFESNHAAVVTSKTCLFEVTGITSDSREIKSVTDVLFSPQAKYTDNLHIIVWELKSN